VSFRSILFEGSDADHLVATEPEFFSDLHLNQIVASITAGLDEFDLKSFFFTPLQSIESIQYRQEIMQAIEEQALWEHIVAFGKSMRRMRELIAESERLTHRYQTQRYILDAVNTYCDAVEALTRGLSATPLCARGLRALRDYLGAYTESLDFRSMVMETRKLAAAIAGVTYTLEIAGLRITVGRYNAESDYGAEVLHTFQKFKQGGAGNYAFSFPSGPRMSHVEEAILDRVARLHPDLFASLGEYVEQYRSYQNEVIREFDREVRFYTACLTYTGAFKSAGWSCCYPTILSDSKECFARDLFDAALAARLIKEKKTRLVGNDFELKGKERVIVVSGANQGGKTTFVRAFGQLHYLALLGCPVPARSAHIFLVDRVYTHFEREEHVRDLSGSLELDLRRVHHILEEATDRSLLIMNESFASTTLADALLLTRKVLSTILERDMICVTVTFFDELAAEPSVVSMVAGVDEADHVARTFKLARRPADGRAYAATIARKYRLTSADLRSRLPT
jgi:DNA mismatch repair protein MutS